MTRVLIAGGSGVFGQRLAALLLADGLDLTLAGRSARRLLAAARRLGDSDRVAVQALDLRDPGALEAAARGHAAVACTAGPFAGLPAGLPAAAVRAGAHWLDISDDREWVRRVLGDGALDAAAHAADLVVAPGCSSVPAISGVLARRCRELLPDAARGRVTLYIGNRNRKGVGSIARALVSGSTDGTPVELPMGRLTAFRFDSPDAVLMREELDLEAEFRAAFELSLGYRVMASVGRPGCARAFAWCTRPLGWFGDRRGCLQVEVWDSAGRRAAAWAIGTDQRMPVVPLACVLSGLLAGSWPGLGVRRVWQDEPPDRWIAALRGAGLDVGERVA